MIIIGLFLLWTLLIYFMHRLAHYRHRFNPLYSIHLSHHKINYLEDENRKFKWYYLLFYFGGVLETMDVLLMLTMPAFMVYFVYPPMGIYLLLFHYLYESFLSEGVLDHNPKIKGKITNFFSWGKYHLIHHKTWKYNYSLMITLWDRVFRTRRIV
jgi:sterol desaturase/sphingolipid hydroxylase (fatty acid hydroxylase superfamily)